MGILLVIVIQRELGLKFKVKSLLRNKNNLHQLQKDIYNILKQKELLIFLIQFLQAHQGRVIVRFMIQIIELIFETDGIDKSKISKQNYLQELGLKESEITFRLNISLRHCEIGE